MILPQKSDTNTLYLEVGLVQMEDVNHHGEQILGLVENLGSSFLDQMVGHLVAYLSYLAPASMHNINNK